MWCAMHPDRVGMCIQSREPSNIRLLTYTGMNPTVHPTSYQIASTCDRHHGTFTLLVLSSSQNS